MNEKVQILQQNIFFSSDCKIFTLFDTNSAVEWKLKIEKEKGACLKFTKFSGCKKLGIYRFKKKKSFFNKRSTLEVFRFVLCFVYFPEANLFENKFFERHSFEWIR